MYDSGVVYAPHGAPVVGNELVYVSVGSDLHALNKEDGSLNWSKAPVYSQGTPLLHDGHLYISGGWQKFTALNAADGTEIWSKDISTYASPVMSNGRLYVNGDESVFCFEPTTGELVWNVPVSDLAHSPVVDGNQVLVSTDYSFSAVYSFDAGTGKEIWKNGTMAPAQTEMIAHTGILYLGTLTSLHGYNLESGDLVQVFGGYAHGTSPFDLNYGSITAVYNTTTKAVVYPTNSGMD